MSTVEQSRTTARAIAAAVDENLAVIDHVMGGLQAATATYRTRPLDWGDVAALIRLREQLGGAVMGFATAEAAAALSRGAREIAQDVRRFRSADR